MAINVKDKLITLESLGVAYSAEQDAREEADQALSTRIDNIVAPEGDPSLSEVADARTSGSTTYNTLKARLDADKAAIGTEISQLSADLADNVNDLKSTITNITGYEAISFTNGKYIKTNLNVGDLVDLTPVTGYNTNNYAIVDAQEGDKFTINATGGNAGRLWCFVDSNNVLLSVAASGAIATNLILTAPANASKLILNPVSGYGEIYKGEYLVDVTNRLESYVNTLNTSVGTLAEELNGARADVDALENAVGTDTYLHNYQSVGFDDTIIPILALNGVKAELLSTSASKSAEQDVSKGDDPVTYTFRGTSGTISKMKVQGSSSVKFPKKNYTLTFSDKFVAKTGWEPAKKYVIKSNFNDFSQARNVCCAKIWHDIAVSRSISHRNSELVDANSAYLVDSNGKHLVGTAEPPYNIGVNYGAIDGFPVIVTINGDYWGLYAFTIPKDAVMAIMDGEGDEAIVSCGGYSTTQAEYFKGTATMQPDANGVTDFETEYSSEGLSDADILASINTAISAVRDNSYATVEDRLATINQYVDIDSATDYFILACLINNTDGIGKNYLLDTWDGVKWFFVPYDMDMVFGNDKWSGTRAGSPKSGLSFRSIASMHELFGVIYTYDTQRFIQRYKEIRASAMSEDNIYGRFADYINQIPNSSYDYEGLRWIMTPGTSIKNFNQIVNWYRLRCEYLDAEVDALENAH